MARRGRALRIPTSIPAASRFGLFSSRIKLSNNIWRSMAIRPRPFTSSARPPETTASAFSCIAASRLWRSGTTLTKLATRQRYSNSLPFSSWNHVRQLAETGWFVWCSAEPLLGPIDIRRAVDFLGWVVTGGESGPGARPPHPDWFRLLRDICLSTGIPYHFKQYGEWAPCGVTNLLSDRFYRFADGQHVERVGKHVAGAVLDGREWREFPAIAEALHG